MNYRPDRGLEDSPYRGNRVVDKRSGSTPALVDGGEAVPLTMSARPRLVRFSDCIWTLLIAASRWRAGDKSEVMVSGSLR
jgi:hypothetical protein